MKIRVLNVIHGEKVPLHLPLLVGEIHASTDDGIIQVRNATRCETVATKWPIIEGAFKVLVRLIPGENNIYLTHEDETLLISLVFTFPYFKYFVRPLYIVLAGEDGNFQGPEDEDCSMESALERIKLGAMLIQTFTAEKMKEHGFGRVTFQLEVDANFEPVCNVFHSQLTIEEASSMTGGDLWNYFARELMTSSHFENKEACKFYCFMSFTRYSPPESEIPATHSEILKYTKGHTALGGGGLALFGTGNLHTWAAAVSDVQRRFTDSRKIDRSRLMDDSAYREFYWANYATGLGASLHELGHTFDLAHTPSGIMARGFDDLHKVFIVQRSKLTGSGDHSGDFQRSTSETGSSLSSLSDESDGHETLAKKNPTACNRKTDVCYGSPYRKPSLPRKSSSGNVYIAPPPLVVVMEQGFRPNPVPQTISFSIRNYDGSHTCQTITHDAETERITEVTLADTGKLCSNNMKRERHASSESGMIATTASQSPARVIPSHLPNSPTDTERNIASIQYSDDGAHWYRASAVLLRFHKWFNKFSTQDLKKHICMSGSRITCSYGFRLVELRSEPDGVVFQHWEYLSQTPPLEFTLKASRLKNLPKDSKSVTIVAEDSVGNILRKKVDLELFE